eukprot:10538956-Alexandrium_andersonii.AAC.1
MAKHKAEELDWYLNHYDHWRSKQRGRKKDYRGWCWYRDKMGRLSYFAGVVQSAIDVVTEKAKEDGSFQLAFAQREAQLQAND